MFGAGVWTLMNSGSDGCAVVMDNCPSSVGPVGARPRGQVLWPLVERFAVQTLVHSSSFSFIS